MKNNLKYILLPFIFTCIFPVCYSQYVFINGIPRDTSFTVYSAYTKAKKEFPYIEIARPELPDNVKEYAGIPYSIINNKRKLCLNIYRPDNNKKYPALLMVHGGGWNSGDLSLQIPMAQKIAAKGYVTLPVEYRLNPEAKYPAAVYDLKTAIRWIRANADIYGIDTTRIAISGCSAGGQLAGLTGATNGQAGYEDVTEYPGYSSTVHAVINIDGISDFTVEEAVKNANISVEKNKPSASVNWLDGTYADNKENWIAASSVYHVTINSAPVCFINSSIPRFHDGRDEIIEKLKKFNIYTEVHTIDNTPHPFWLFHPWFDKTVEIMTSYLDSIFHP